MEKSGQRQLWKFFETVAKTGRDLPRGSADPGR